jgi:hypothetical protein
VQPFVIIGHLEFKLLSTFTMNFSLVKPDFTKYFASKTKYSIAITADDSGTQKFLVLEDGPPKLLSSGTLSLMSLHSSRISMLPSSL